MIQINNLEFHYKKSKPIIKDITTTLNPGRIYGLLGLNAEGKTTFLKLLSGLLFPNTGTVTLDSISSKERSKAFLEKLYMLPDTPTTPKLSANYYVEIYSPFYTNFSHTFFKDAVKALGINTNEWITSLSLGQQKKFHIAFALATNTKFLFLDEPTNGLDIPSKAIVRKLLAQSITDEKTFIISTHLVNDVQNLLDHLLIIKDGKLAFDSSIVDILKQYTFSHTNTALAESIYSEQSISIHRNILMNTNDTESNIDIELLFNAVQQNKIIQQPTRSSLSTLL